jgi:aminoglycoside phosphotransferase (APT) family kinase protein
MTGPARTTGTIGQAPADRLRAVLGPVLGLNAADITIDNLRPLRVISAHGTWAFDAVTPFERRALFLHTGRPGRGYQQQAQVQAAAAAQGVPVPPILAAEDSDDALGSPFLISAAVRGEASYSRIVGQLESADRLDGRERLLRQCAQAVAGIHRIDAHTPESARWFRLSICRRTLDDLGDTSATFEWAVRWLTSHEPPPSPPVLVHGDYRIGNLVVDGSDLAAVLDWEWVHIGEANEDLAWFCMRSWRFPAPASLGAGGLGSTESFLSAYEEASGTVVDRVGFHWWLVMTTLFRGVMCLKQAELWSTKEAPSVTFAIIGHQVCEMEYDLLNLFDRGAD